MTAKEKAVELIDFFTFNCKECDNAKISALIAVDEIIQATNMYQYGISNALEHIPSKIVKHPYWQEVKQEIENL